MGAHHGRERRATPICFLMWRQHAEKHKLQPTLFAEMPASKLHRSRRPRHQSHAAAPPNNMMHQIW
jgi:hypothetical protein